MVSDTLSALYPFLQSTARDPAALQVGLLTSIKSKAEDSIAVKQAFFAVQAEALLAAAQDLAEVYRKGGRLFVMGNGGSSCDAAHVAVEFQHPVTAGREALPAINLGADVALLTAVGNDVGFGHVYSRQLIAQARTGDALLGISTSGNSENLVSAFSRAQTMGLLTVGLAGGDGGRMCTSGHVQHCLVVPSRSIHRVQECQVAIYHILWDLVHTLLADSRGHGPAEDKP